MNIDNSVQAMYKLWESVVSYLQDTLGVSNIAMDMWINSLSFTSIKNNVVTLECDNDFHKNIIVQQFIDKLGEAFEQVLGFPITIDLVSLEHKPNIPPVPANDNFDSNFFFHRNVETGDYTFENFVVGNSNRFAHAAAQAVASSPSSNYNPLFIYGESGLGKTHLLYAICAYIRENNPKANVVYTKCDEMTTQFINAVKEGTMDKFDEYYKNADVLLVDDIQFLVRKTETQEKFFHTFDYLHSAGRQIILTSDRPPREIETLAERLRSRFEMGLLADIQPPDEETRIAILKKKAYLLDKDMYIPDEVCEFLAQGKKFTNIRQLEGIVKHLHAQYKIGGRSITLQLAQSALRDFAFNDTSTPITVDRVIEEVSRTFNVSVADIHSKKRNAPISRARQVVFYILSNTTNMTQKEIGEEVGAFDHTTVIHSLKKVDEVMQENTVFKNTVNDIIKNLKGL